MQLAASLWSSPPSGLDSSRAVVVPWLSGQQCPPGQRRDWQCLLTPGKAQLDLLLPIVSGTVGGFSENMGTLFLLRNSISSRQRWRKTNRREAPVLSAVWGLMGCVFG